jgi:hypothetical protein
LNLFTRDVFRSSISVHVSDMSLGILTEPDFYSVVLILYVKKNSLYKLPESDKER